MVGFFLILSIALNIFLSLLVINLLHIAQDLSWELARIHDESEEFRKEIIKNLDEKSYDFFTTFKKQREKFKEKANR